MSALTAPDFPSATDLSVWLPQYEVRERIQAGEEGALYFARQTALDRHVEIEVIPAPPPDRAAALMERLRLRARLVHPSITAIYDFGETPMGQLYLVGEHVEGEFLETLIHKGEIRPKTAFPLAVQVCEALQIVHDLPMPHGTLAPQTILVTPEGRIKLTGIGMTPSASGELSWLEPFRGSVPDDIILLGWTLHWMFAKAPPEEDGRLSRDLPPAFATVIRRCLDPHAGGAFSRADDVAAALKDALRGEQERTDAPTARNRRVISPGAKTAPAAAASATTAAPSSPAPAAATAATPPPPPQPLPNHLRPVVRQHHQPTFMQRLDAFVWKAFSTGLHVLISVASIGSLILILMFKDRISFEEDTTLPMATVETMDAAEPPIPAAVMGQLPEPEDLPVGTMIVKPISLPPPAPEPAPPAMEPAPDLRAQYVEAVQKAANHALEKVLLNDLPHLQRELQLLQNGGEIPEVDEPDLPASLKALRQRYREVRASGGPEKPAGSP